MFVPTVINNVCASDIGLAHAECDHLEKDQGPALDDHELWWLATLANGCGCKVPGVGRQVTFLRWVRTVTFPAPLTRSPVKVAGFGLHYRCRLAFLRHVRPNVGKGSFRG